MICPKCIHEKVCKYKTKTVYECEHFADETIKNQYDRIRNMSIDEMTQFICTIAEHCYYDECKDCPIYNVCGVCDCSDLHIRKYLESEVTE